MESRPLDDMCLYVWKRTFEEVKQHAEQLYGLVTLDWDEGQDKGMPTTIPLRHEDWTQPSLLVVYRMKRGWAVGENWDGIYPSEIRERVDALQKRAKTACICVVQHGLPPADELDFLARASSTNW